MSVTVNHEINQPLTVIKGYDSLLEKALLDNDLSELQQKYFKKIKKSINDVEKF